MLLPGVPAPWFRGNGCSFSKVVVVHDGCNTLETVVMKTNFSSVVFGPHSLIVILALSLASRLH